MKSADDWFADSWDRRRSSRFTALAWIVVAVVAIACLAVYIFWSGPTVFLAVGGIALVLIALAIDASRKRTRKGAAGPGDAP